MDKQSTLPTQFAGREKTYFQRCRQMICPGMQSLHFTKNYKKKKLISWLQVAEWKYSMFDDVMLFYIPPSLCTSVHVPCTSTRRVGGVRWPPWNTRVGSPIILRATIRDIWIIPSFRIWEIVGCISKIFRVSSWIVANIGESSLLFSQ